MTEFLHASKSEESAKSKQILNLIFEQEKPQPDAKGRVPGYLEKETGDYKITALFQGKEYNSYLVFVQEHDAKTGRWGNTTDLFTVDQKGGIWVDKRKEDTVRTILGRIIPEPELKQLLHELGLDEQRKPQKMRN